MNPSATSLYIKWYRSFSRSRDKGSVTIQYIPFFSYIVSSYHLHYLIPYVMKTRRAEEQLPPSHSIAVDALVIKTLLLVLLFISLFVIHPCSLLIQIVQGYKPKPAHIHLFFLSLFFSSSFCRRQCCCADTISIIIIILSPSRYLCV